jgi:hypothetical protein
MDNFQQLLGNPNPLQALLQPQSPYAMPGMAPMEPTAMPDLSELAGPGASSPLAAIASAISAGGAGGTAPMDEAPNYDGPNAGSAAAGLGPDLQQSLGLGAGPSAMTGSGDADAGQYTLGVTPVSTGYTPPPRPPDPLDERTLHPSGTRNIMQGVMPGIAALIAGLTGGKESAAAVLQGANAGNQAYNADLKERGLRKYQQAQQSYARDHQLWQDEQQRLEHNTSIIASLAEKAKSFANPADGLAWLKSQEAIYAKQGVNVMDAWKGVEVGADTRRKDYLAGKLKTVIDTMRQQAKDSGRVFDESKLDDNMAIRIDGETKPLSVWRELADALPPSAGRGATTSAIEQKVESDVQDQIAIIRARTGREPLTAEVSQIRKDEWNKVATEQDQSEEMKKLALEHARKANRYLDATTAEALAKAHAGGGITSQQDIFARSRMAELSRNKVFVQAQAQGNLYDQFLQTMNDPHPNGITDQTLIAEFIRAKHPGSARVGDQESMRIELARAGVSNPQAIAAQLFSGTALLPKQRQEMADVLKRSYEASRAGAEMLMDGYQSQLEARQIPPQPYLLPGVGSTHDPIRPKWQRDLDAKDAAEEAAQKQTQMFRPGSVQAFEGGAAAPAGTPAQIRASGGRPLIPGAQAAQGKAPAQAGSSVVTDPEGKGMVITDPNDGKRYQILGKNAAGQYVKKEL